MTFDYYRRWGGSYLPPWPNHTLLYYIGNLGSKNALKPKTVQFSVFKEKRLAHCTKKHRFRSCFFLPRTLTNEIDKRALFYSKTARTVPFKVQKYFPSGFSVEDPVALKSVPFFFIYLQ